jgi:oxygen-independent coproporphyrinogen-3 oxidase
MKVFINHDFKYEVGHLMQAFGLQANFVSTRPEADLINTLSYEDEFALVYCKLNEVKEAKLSLNNLSEKDKKRALKHLNSKTVYEALSAHTEKSLPWGTLVGVRPVKIVHPLLNEEMTTLDLKKHLKFNYHISDEKIDLMLQVAQAEKPFLQDIDLKPISLYLSVPFCPSQCLYCSFPSNSVEKKGHLMASYLQVLIKEIETAHKCLEITKQKVDCIYIGGGTPTTLSVDDFEKLFAVLNHTFDLKHLKEFTIEAGRPNTITKEKLALFKKNYVTRLCLNPQTMKDETLKRIGRAHTVEAIREVYDLIKAFDFKTVNMDLILGLPGETYEDVQKTIRAVLDLSPENITVHTLAIKKHSLLNYATDDFQLADGETVKQMIDYVQSTLEDHGYKPYYLYRQKNIAGNFENVGYSKPGHISTYNIRIIEEKHSILALGPGAISKKCDASRDFFERIPTIKGLEAYIDRQEDVLSKVKEFFK